MAPVTTNPSTTTTPSRLIINTTPGKITTRHGQQQQLNGNTSDNNNNTTTNVEDDVLVSPNQLQGVLVESLKTPIPYTSNGRHHHDGTTTILSSFPTEKGNTSGSTVVFEPENNQAGVDSDTADGGIAWLLYRQRSRSTGAIPSKKPTTFTTTTATTAAVSVAATAVVAASETTEESGEGESPHSMMPTTPLSSLVLSVSSKRTRAVSGQTEFQQNSYRQSILFNKITALVKGPSSLSCSNVALPDTRDTVGQMSSNGHDYSLPHSHSQDNHQERNNIYKSSHSGSVLAISTSSLPMDPMAAQDVDGVHSTYFSNQHPAHQQQQHPYYGMMTASSPASTVSDTSHLPPLSTTTTNTSTSSSYSNASTCSTCSYASSSSYSSSTYSTYTSSSSTASTLCNHSPHPHHHHPHQLPSHPTTSQPSETSFPTTGIQKMMRWSRAALRRERNEQDVSTVFSSQNQYQHHSTHNFGDDTNGSKPLTSALSNGEGGGGEGKGEGEKTMTTLGQTHSAYFQPREGPTLKELSGRKTRYYDKRGRPVLPSDSQKPSSSSSSSPPGGTCSRRAGHGGGKKRGKKVDLKALFSNERTYMHWIKFGLLLGTMALNLISFGQHVGQQVGLFLVLVAMSSLVYSTTIFHLRHIWMAAMRVDVLYYDRYGPTLLFAALFFAYATNVALTMYKMLGDSSDDSSQGYFNMDKGPLDI